MLQETIRKVLAGDKDAYSAIVAEHQDMLLAYAGFRAPDRDLADEVVHETFIRAYSQLGEYDPERDFGTWLRTICKFVLMTELKRSARERKSREGFREHIRRQLRDLAFERRQSVADADTLGLLKDCLGGLGPSQRKLLEHRYGRRATTGEIARLFGRSAAWVATTLFRIRGALRECMERHMGSEVA